MVLDCALQLVLAPPRVDATARVLERWRAGERGDPRALGEPVEDTPRRWRWWWLVPAAALVVAAFMIWPRNGASALARSDEPVAVLRSGSMHATNATRFVPGDTLLVDGPAVTRIALADGTRLELGPRTLLELAERDGVPLLVPRLGSLRVERDGGNALLIDSAFGTLEVGPRAALEIELDADDYRTPFPRLTQEIHMNMNTLFLSATLTLVSGTAYLQDGPAPGPLTPGETRTQTPPKDPLQELLLAEIGTWDLEITEFTRGSDETRQYRGIETCSAGPGNEWVISDTRLRRGNSLIADHVVLGYSRHHQRYFGSLVDNFGGGIGLIEGAPGPDPRSRILTMRLLDEEASARDTMRWIGDDERHTLTEVREGGAWIKVRETRHLRRK